MAHRTLWRIHLDLQMKLGAKQELFSIMIAQLIVWAYEQGYKVRLGHAMRCRDCPVGRKTSLHKDKLAADLNLFKDGKYLTTTEDHRPLGEHWEQMGGSWGGRFNDGNHYSLEHNGRR